MMKQGLLYKPYGNRAILVQWPEIIDENQLQEVLFCKNSLEKKYPELILEITSSYNSLLIFYHSTIEDFYNAVFLLKSHNSTLILPQKQKNTLWTIPVCYDQKFAPDMEFYCSQKKLEKEQVVSWHSDKIYTVYFIGFLPGFLYLGGLDERLFLPRKTNPSLNVSKGAVAIGGKQTGIYPQNSPGGWCVIGQSPMSFFEVKKDHPCFVAPGDKVMFESISISKYNAISSLVEAGVYIPKNKIYEG